MKNIRIFVMLLQAAFVLIASCAIANSLPYTQVSTNTEVHAKKSTINSTSDLRRLLKLGMGTNHITAEFGVPPYSEKSPDGEITWMYRLRPFPADDEMKGTRVVGLTMEITNGCLRYWSCEYEAVNPHPGSQNHLLEPNKDIRRGVSTPLRLFAVESNALMVGQSVDNAQLSKLGSEAAGLTISHLKDATWSAGKNQMWSVNVFMEPEDQAKLKSLTETNISKTMLVIVGHRLVSTGKIRAPLEYGIVIEGSGQTQLDAIKSDLSDLIPQK